MACLFKKVSVLYVVYVSVHGSKHVHINRRAYGGLGMILGVVSSCSPPHFVRHCLSLNPWIQLDSPISKHLPGTIARPQAGVTDVWHHALLS